MKIRTICCFVELEASDFLLLKKDDARSAAEENENEKDLSLFFPCVENKLMMAKRILDSTKSDLEDAGYVVQTARVTFNPIEEWLVENSQEANEAISEFNKFNKSNECGATATTGAERTSAIVLYRLRALLDQLDRHDIAFVSLGGCTEEWCIPLVPVLLQASPRLSCSVRLDSTGPISGPSGPLPAGILGFQRGAATSPPNTITANPRKCLLAAEACKTIAETCGSAGNFRFCTTFDCRGSRSGNSPFFPASSYDKHGRTSTAVKLGLGKDEEEGKDKFSQISKFSQLSINGNGGGGGGVRLGRHQYQQKEQVQICDFAISVGFENGDLLFIASYAAESLEEARDNLSSTLRQAYLPVQKIVKLACNRLSHSSVALLPERDQFEKDYDTDRYINNNNNNSSSSSSTQKRSESTPDYSVSAIYGGGERTDISLHGDKRTAIMAVARITYAGIDGSINPGLGPADGVGVLVENLLCLTQYPGRLSEEYKQAHKDEDVLPQFGDPGTLSVISALTAGIKCLALDSSSITSSSKCNSSNSNSNSNSNGYSTSPSSSNGTGTGSSGNNSNSNSNSNGDAIKSDSSVFALYAKGKPFSGEMEKNNGTIGATGSTGTTGTTAGKGVYVGDGDGDSIKLCGYSGVMLPVMEDIVLAQRANQKNGTQRGSYGLRDLLTFSSVCGVGIDTVPVSLQQDHFIRLLAGVYAETASLAYRLNKPLSARVLPFALPVGKRTDVPEDNPYLVNTDVFSLR